ncbi:MAG TPA: hypothetical protein VN554_00435 [Verrucomicrobiae bacterium]|nr:hypothetical protein [Verrucomicrobiae bacterium]
MTLHGGMPSPGDRNLSPRYEYEGSLPVRVGKRVVNFLVERLGGERPFEPIQRGGALAVAGARESTAPLEQVPPDIAPPDEEQGARILQLRTHPPEDPNLN